MRCGLYSSMAIALGLILAGVMVFCLTPGPTALADGSGLSGFVWSDINNNNQIDDDEQRVPGVSVGAKPLGPSDGPGYDATTDSEGSYSLSLPEGSWSIFATQYIQAQRSMTYTLTAVDVVAGQQTTLNLGIQHPTAHADPTAVDAKIEILWPHDHQGQQRPVSEAELANIAAYLFHSGTDATVPCAFDPVVRLWRTDNTASENRVAQFVGTGQRQSITIDDKTFNRWVFNDVDVSAARDPLSKVFFFITVDGVRVYHNVWSHGADARTYFPVQDKPTSIADGNQQNEPIDARIEIVWPHDAAGDFRPVDQASLVNIGVDLYQYGTRRSVPADWNPTVKLYRALNNAPGLLVASGKKTLITNDGITYPRWVFDDIDVSQAQDSLNKYYFYVSVNGVTTYSNVWSHGADARTYFPNPDVPSSGCQ